MADKKWVKKQLDAAGYNSKSGERYHIREVVELLFLQLDHAKFADDDEKRTAIELFYKLFNGRAIAADLQGDNHEWKQFLLGDYPAGVTVRVKSDAYEGAAGESHNGMVGKLVAARGGKAIVQYAQSTEGTGHRHEPDLIEVLVR